LVELANHLFGWAGDLIIEQPEALKDVMCERLAAAQTMARPDLS
jgi:predicted DNA-binding transcriptional regulator YafY